MGKLSLGSDSNSRLNIKVISGAIWLLPLICPHRLKDFSKTHKAVDTPDQGTTHRKDGWTRVGRCGQQWRTQRPRLTEPLWRVPKVTKYCASVCVVYSMCVFCIYTRDTLAMLKSMVQNLPEIVLSDFSRLQSSQFNIIAKLGFHSQILCTWESIKELLEIFFVQHPFSVYFIKNVLIEFSSS